MTRSLLLNEPALELADFAFARHGRALLGFRGEGAGFERNLAELRRAPAQLEPLASGECWVGALPFEDAHPVCLFRPEALSHCSLHGGDGTPVVLPASAAPHGDRAGFGERVRDALQAIEAGALDKVVLARFERLRRHELADPGSVLRRLHARNPQGYTFSLRLESGRTLVGSSPELLVAKRGAVLLSNPMAGSAPRSPDPAEDRARGADLLRSEKDLREHRWVVEHVLSRLSPLCSTLRWPPHPALVGTPNMWHLVTPIEGTAQAGVTALSAALALHPTPAVCGFPSAAAAAWVRAHEPMARGYYAGAVGYVDHHGDGEWAVTLRCAELSATGATLYAGAGVVRGSTPEGERAETDSKLQLILHGLREGGC